MNNKLYLCLLIYMQTIFKYRNPNIMQSIYKKYEKKSEKWIQKQKHTRKKASCPQ